VKGFADHEILYPISATLLYRDAQIFYIRLQQHKLHCTLSMLDLQRQNTKQSKEEPVFSIYNKMLSVQEAEQRST
jgi:hypothetical protein